MKGSRRKELMCRERCVCVCFTIEQKGHAGEPLNWSDQQLHQCLPATFWLGLVDLRGQRQDRVKIRTLKSRRLFG